MWAEGMTAWRGWIALALVVFASWRPWRLLAGASLFGGVTIAQLYTQGAGGLGIPSQVMSMLPYLATILVLTIIAAGPWKGRLNARSEEHTSELQSLMRSSYAVFCLKKKRKKQHMSNQSHP